MHTHLSYSGPAKRCIMWSIPGKKKCYKVHKKNVRTSEKCLLCRERSARTQSVRASWKMLFTARKGLCNPNRFTPHEESSGIK
jgi:hypothetical protein